MLPLPPDEDEVELAGAVKDGLAEMILDSMLERNALPAGQGLDFGSIFG